MIAGGQRRLRAARPAVAALLGLALTACATGWGGFGGRAGDDEMVRALAVRYLLTLYPAAGRFTVVVEGADPAGGLLERLAAHREIGVEDARTLSVTPSGFRPGFAPDRRVVLELGPLRRAAAGSVTLEVAHTVPGEERVVCPLTLAERDGIWAISRASDPGCRPRS